MTKAQRRAIGAYAREAADALELRDWTVNIDHEPVPDDDDGEEFRAWADCRCIYGRKQIFIRFANDFVTLDADRQRHIIVHELSHAVLTELQDDVRCHLPKHLSQQSYDLFYAGFYQRLEYAVDQIATIGAKLLHKPEIPR